MMKIVWSAALALNVAMSAYQIWGLLQPAEFMISLWNIAFYAVTPITAVAALILTRRTTSQK
jgi:hypothetical protein